MTHLDGDGLTAWAHDLPGAEEAEAHLEACGECRSRAEAVRMEARALSRAIGDPARLEALKKSLVDRASRPRRAGLLWQVPAAAAVLFALVVALALPAQNAARLVDGRVRIGEDDRELTAPAILPAGEVIALEPATLRLGTRSTVEMDPDARIGLAPGPAADVRAGRIRVAVTGGGGPVVVRSGAGRLESAGGRFDVDVVAKHEGGTEMKGLLTGIVVTVLAGSVSLTNAEGTVEAAGGRTAVLAPSEAPLFVSQDDPETLLRRLEQLAAAIARLEAEISKLEALNARLKTQLKNGVTGKSTYFFGGKGGSAAGVRVLKTGDADVHVESVILQGNTPSKKKEK